MHKPSDMRFCMIHSCWSYTIQQVLTQFQEPLFYINIMIFKTN